LALSLTPSLAQASPKPAKPRVARVGSQHSCLKRPVEIVAGKETATLALAECDGTASTLGVAQVSVLMRPSGVAKPKEPLAELAKGSGIELAPGIRRVDPRLVEKLEQVADHFRKDGRRESIVLLPISAAAAGPASTPALVRAANFRIEGVGSEGVAVFCKTLSDVDCSRRPRAKIVHIEVRAMAAAPATDEPRPQTAPTPDEPSHDDSTGTLAPLPPPRAPAMMVAPLKSDGRPHFL
jgi:hypothetical protein